MTKRSPKPVRGWTRVPDYSLVDTGATVRFAAARVAASGRGRVETSNLPDHAVLARSEAFGIVTAALYATAWADRFDRGRFESHSAEAPGSPCSGVYFAGERASSPHRLHQRSDAHDLYHAFEVVGQYMETHLGTDARQPLSQEMGRAHPGFERTEGMFDSLPA